MAVTFNPPKAPTSSGFRRNHTARVERVEFEAGYSQRSTDPNPVRRSVEVTFQRLTIADRDAILAFFAARKGSEAFLYAAPGDPAQILWTCARWSEAPHGDGKWRITASWTEEFDL